jgi:hypothetical protein
MAKKVGNGAGRTAPVIQDKPFLILKEKKRRTAVILTSCEAAGAKTQKGQPSPAAPSYLLLC